MTSGPMRGLKKTASDGANTQTDGHGDSMTESVKKFTIRLDHLSIKVIVCVVAISFKTSDGKELLVWLQFVYLDTLISYMSIYIYPQQTSGITIEISFSLRSF